MSFPGHGAGSPITLRVSKAPSPAPAVGQERKSNSDSLLAIGWRLLESLLYQHIIVRWASITYLPLLLALGSNGVKSTKNRLHAM
jgi:hypothetical protein